ncbi:hypothetical protein V495_06114 [Pseudogymnoascus sp. VKM F-4514 (FW-929)]|nr:hypothetical protein V495_06114 [Pseudogymnoascus sp. VKM F-4514 (FW-929)]KFY55478.1 hypothetical protein V497_06941 [Pseudogymnoascus sp. VKM F-4516 (FW-969)]
MPLSLRVLRDPAGASRRRGLKTRRGHESPKKRPRAERSYYEAPEEAKEVAKAYSWESRKLGRPQSGRTRGWQDHKPREDCAWSSTREGKDLKPRSKAIATDDPQTTRKHDRPRRRHGVVKVNLFPLRDPTLAASATRNSNARTPPCEDGVDPFATTVGAANDF